VPVAKQFVIRNCTARQEGGSRALGNDFLSVSNKELQGKRRREDPELSGTISWFCFIRNCK